MKKTFVWQLLKPYKRRQRACADTVSTTVRRLLSTKLEMIIALARSKLNIAIEGNIYDSILLVKNLA